VNGRRSLKSRWKARLFTTGVVTATVEVTLFALYEDMHEDGSVSVPMTRMVKRLSSNPWRILAHYQAAIDAGLLAQGFPRVRGPHRGLPGHASRP
jgi:hypothetical protein